MLNEEVSKIFEEINVQGKQYFITVTRDQKEEKYCLCMVSRDSGEIKATEFVSISKLLSSESEKLLSDIRDNLIKKVEELNEKK